MTACNQAPLKTEAEKQAELDSFSIAKYGMTSEERVNQMTDSIMGDALMDTSGLSNAPVKVTKSTLFKKEYSSYRDIRLTFKNVSKKKVSAIKFKWKGVNAFGDPADMGGTIDGFGAGFTDTPLAANRSSTLEWSILSRDGKKVLLAWPYEVVFADGSKWVLGL